MEPTTPAWEAQSLNPLDHQESPYNLNLDSENVRSILETLFGGMWTLDFEGEIGWLKV